MKVMIKCCECNRTQMADCETTANLALHQGAKCEGCGVEFNAFSVHCMKVDIEEPKEDEKQD